ncbi:unnamed protein product [Lactuca virosa]|uniref:PGG domain-containing protein n=1 Tax=Lactuca virosa TaxID=75947 RepID=A0AAU9PFU5_9ASTR|nr:unnamed protein product [Lactuca virosa]
MASSSSSSNQHVTLDVGEEYTYPYPSNPAAAGFISVKLSGRDKYGVWKTQMLCLLKSHGMFGFVDGTLVSPQTSSSVYRREKVCDHNSLWLWTRSDALVKGWILGSLSEQTLMDVVDRLTEKLHLDRNAAEDFSAKDVWDELQTMYAPPAVVPQLPPVVEDTLQGEDEEDRALNLQRLYKYAQEEYWDVVEGILSHGRVTVTDKITNNGNTVLHVAVGISKNPELLEKLLERIPENTQLMELRNSDGSTLLHVAAIIGNTQAADILVARNPELLLAEDNEGQTPLALALSNMHTDTARHLLQHINNTDDIQKDALFSGKTGDELLVSVISSKDFRFARKLLKHYTTLHSDAVLMAIAQNFPSQVNMFERYKACIYRIDRSSPWVDSLIISVIILVTYLILMLLLFIPGMLVWLSIKERVETHEDAMRLLDSYGNNLLHLAARLAPNNKLNLILAAALQIQRELQWFKEVEKFICPLSVIQKNSFNETPQMVFSR